MTTLTRPRTARPTRTRRARPARGRGAPTGALLLALAATAAPALADPASVTALRSLEERVTAVAEHALPATVAVLVGSSRGSGVIVSEDGLVLTAGHVIATPGRPAIVVLADGRRVRGETLGLNQRVDSGMVRITEPGPWPAVELGTAEALEEGSWVVALGHPGGVVKERSPVVRFGQVRSSSPRVVHTDCPIVSGDSGGPLFDLDGKLVAIHVSLHPGVTNNYHLPVDTYVRTWDRLLEGLSWGRWEDARPILGVRCDSTPRGCRVRTLLENLPAERAGLATDDVIARIDGHPVVDMDALIMLVWERQVGDEVALEVWRGDELLEFDVALAAHPRN